LNIIKKNITFVGLALILMASIFHVGTGCKGEAEAGPEAPNFSLPSIDGGMVSLEDFRGSIVLIDFWATWCPPCRMSIPELIRLQNEYEDEGLVILGVSLDDPAQAPDAYLKAFKEKYKINYPILRANKQVMLDYFGLEAPAIPTMFVVDRTGRVTAKIVGFQPAALRNSIKKLIKG